MKQSLKIEIGDTVEIFWVSGDKLTGIVRRIPQNTGDMWNIEESEHRSIWAINPNSSNLDVIIKRSGKNEN